MAYPRPFITLSALLGLAGAVSPASAEVIEKELAVGAFEELQTGGAFDVVIGVGKSRKIIARGDRQAVERLRTSVSDGKLKIWQDYNPKRNYKEPSRLKVTINIEKLTSIALRGAGDITAYNLDAKDFAVNMSGAGDVKLFGTCATLTASLSGAGDLDAAGLKCKSVSAKVYGVGDMSVSASESVTGGVSGVGDLVVFGNPQNRNTKVSGMGDVSFR
jgi:hypothetical protein